MPHGTLSLGGPVYVFVIGLLGVAVCLAAFVVWDSLRRGAARANTRLREPLWVYTAFQAAYVVLFALSLVPTVTSIVGLPFVIATPLALAEQVAYLLRVVYPKPESAGPELAPPADAIGDLAHEPTRGETTVHDRKR